MVLNMDRNILFAALVAAVLCGAVAASDDVGTRFSSVGCEIYNGLKGVLPIIIVVVIIFAGVIYMLGQVFGAEMKQKAQSWAQNMIIGVLIAIIVVLAVPALIGLVAPELSLDTACT
jgi:sorbitol-specific phosphotransferase system component IIC